MFRQVAAAAGGATVSALLIRGLLNKQKTVSKTIADFFGKDILTLPILTAEYPLADLANPHLAINHYIQTHAIEHQVIGYISDDYRQGLSILITPRASFWATEVLIGPVQYRKEYISPQEQIDCVANGIYLIRTNRGTFALHLYSPMMDPHNIIVEVLADKREQASRFLDNIRQYVYTHNIYRNKIITLEAETGRWGRCVIRPRFIKLEPIQREQIILPETIKQVIERNTIGFLQQAEHLRRSGRSLKRGILLYGKPGTGKTLTARWLASTLSGVTTIVLAAEQLEAVRIACQMARLLQPALVIMEDVDLIASPRDPQRHPFYQITLHQLLNEMDGIESEAQVLFLLTTNRPEMLEPALVTRPGRIDQAIHLPLPDAECRRQLFELYGRGMHLMLTEYERFIQRTEGASPAFIQELLRRAALIAAEQNALHEDGRVIVRDSHLEMALREMLWSGDELTRRLLGFEEAPTEALTHEPPS
ncbi:MAG: ATP-binding protein [Armatimonadota bacterium]